MPLRKEGQVRPQGAYPLPVKGGGGLLKAADWALFGTTKVEKELPWKKS